MEIPNRRESESEYADRLKKLSKRHRRELRRLLGDPPDPANVPGEFWDKIEREMEEENATLLFLLFLASARFHAFGTYSEKGQDTGVVATLEQQAQTYRDSRAKSVARSYAQTSRERFEICLVLIPVVA